MTAPRRLRLLAPEGLSLRLGAARRLRSMRAPPAAAGIHGDGAKLSSIAAARHGQHSVCLQAARRNTRGSGLDQSARDGLEGRVAAIGERHALRMLDAEVALHRALVQRVVVLEHQLAKELGPAARASGILPVAHELLAAQLDERIEQAAELLR